MRACFSYACLSGGLTHPRIQSRYDIFAINIAAVMLGYVYGHSEFQYISQGTRTTYKCSRHWTDQKLSENQDLGIKVATPVGTVFGQLIFGWLADVFGRKRMCTFPTHPLLVLTEKGRV